jgi:hypothetical protein
VERVYGDAGRDYLVGWLRIGSAQVVDGGPDVNGLQLDLRQQPGSPEVPWNEAAIDLAHGVVTADGQRARILGNFHGISVGSPRSALHWTLIGPRSRIRFRFSPYPRARWLSTAVEETTT